MESETLKIGVGVVVLLAAGFVLWQAMGSGQAPAESVFNVTQAAEAKPRVEVQRELVEDLFQAASKARGPATVAEAEALPMFPTDFFTVKALLEHGRVAFSGIPERYWVQPELYPGFEDGGRKLRDSADKTRWGVEGYGSFPPWSEVSVSPGGSFVSVFFIRSGWLVSSYQVIGFSFKQQGGLSVQAVPEAVVLEPSFPKFRQGWVRRVEVRGRVPSSAKPGDYELVVEPAFATPGQVKTLEGGYPGVALHASGLVSTGEPLHRVTVRVVNG